MPRTKKILVEVARKNPVMVLRGILVTHTKTKPATEEVVYRITNSSEPKVGDIFGCWAHGKLAYMKVTKVLNKYEYLKAENNDVELEDVAPVLVKVDTHSYNVFKAFGAKVKRLRACLSERVANAKSSNEIADILRGMKGESKMQTIAIMDAIKALEENPESALED